MYRNNFTLNLLLGLALVCVSPGTIAAPGDVLTHGYNRYRTGAQLEENILNVANVKASSFGKVASLPVDGYVHVQTLVVNSLSMEGGTELDVVYIATGNNSLFAYDVTHNRNQLLWKPHLATTRRCVQTRTIG